MWISIGHDWAVPAGEIIAIIDWRACRQSPASREMVSYARAHGFLQEEEGPLRTLVITDREVFLVSASAGRIARKTGQT